MRPSHRICSSLAVALVIAFAPASVRAQQAPEAEEEDEVEVPPGVPHEDQPVHHHTEDEAEDHAADAHEDAVATPDAEAPSVVSEPFEIPPEEPQPPFVGDPHTPAVHAADEPVSAEELRFWGVRDRFFMSGVVDVGLLFLRPRFQFGYGTPHELWGGFQIDPIASTSGVGLYAGLRGEVPHVDFRIGGRYRFSFGNSFLVPLDGYDHITFRDRTQPSASYLSWETQLSFDIPIDSTAIIVEGTATYLTLAPNEQYVYEESLRVISPPGFIWSAVLGYRIRFGDARAFQITPQIEVVHLTERDEFIIRAGLRASIRLWPDLEARAIIMPAWYGPDRLGAAGGDTFLIGLRYLWATDAPRFGH